MPNIIKKEVNNIDVSNINNETRTEVVSLDVINATSSLSEEFSGVIPIYSLTSSSKQENLTFATFFDSFSNNFLINTEKSDLNIDTISGAVTFKPNYSWQKTDSGAQIKNRPVIFNNNFSEDFSNYYDKRCVNSNCFEQKGMALYFNGKQVLYPSEIEKDKLKAVSFDLVGDKWLVGFTLKNDKDYFGLVYYFNGKDFVRTLNNNSFNSPYFGVFSFGGEVSDFLVIYGSYKGIAYRVRDQHITDVSKFFDYRIMDKGFHSEIIKVKSEKYSNWYIFSSSYDKAKFFKLWEDDNQEITGEIFYTGILSNEEYANFYLIKNSSSVISFLVKIKKNNQDYYQLFNDYGFDNKKSATIFFNKIIKKPAVNIKKIANSFLGSKDFPFFGGKFFFSRDGIKWINLPQGYFLNQEFALNQVGEFFLKIDFSSQNNQFFSPFLSDAVFDFYYEK